MADQTAKNADEPNAENASEPPPHRKSKLSPAVIDALLEQSARGVAYLREQLDQVFRLPRRPLRLR